MTGDDFRPGPVEDRVAAVERHLQVHDDRFAHLDDQLERRTVALCPDEQRVDELEAAIAALEARTDKIDERLHRFFMSWRRR